MQGRECRPVSQEYSQPNLWRVGDSAERVSGRTSEIFEVKKLDIDFLLLAESVRDPKLTLEGAVIMLRIMFEQAMLPDEGLCANPRVEHCGLHRKSQSCIKWESQ